MEPRSRPELGEIRRAKNRIGPSWAPVCCVRIQRDGAVPPSGGVCGGSWGRDKNSGEEGKANRENNAERYGDDDGDVGRGDSPPGERYSARTFCRGRCECEYGRRRDEALGLCLCVRIPRRRLLPHLYSSRSLPVLLLRRQNCGSTATELMRPPIKDRETPTASSQGTNPGGCDIRDKKSKTNTRREARVAGCGVCLAGCANEWASTTSL